jgi:hypothetical protein
MRRILSIILSIIFITQLTYGATSSVDVTPGTGKVIATNSISEDAVTKELQRVVPNTSAGVEIAPLTDTQLRATAVPVSGTVAVTSAGITTIAGAVAGTEMQVDVLTMPSTAVTNAGITSIDSKVPALGQALAAASVPVVLTAAQITTLTPVSAVTVTNSTATNLKSEVVGTGTFATQSVLTAGTAEIGKLAAGVAEIGNVKNSGTFAVQAAQSGTYTSQAVQSGTWTTQAICTNAGTFAVQAAQSGTYTTQAIQSGTWTTQAIATAVGTIADDATTPSAPVMTGGKAVETDGTDPTSVSAEDDVAIFRSDRNRRLLVNTAHPNQHVVAANYTTAQTDTEVIAAPGANLSIYVTDFIVSNGATAGTILFEEDTASAKTQKSVKLYPAINGGCSANFQTPIRCTANKNFGIVSATVTTHSIEVHYYIAP